MKKTLSLALIIVLLTASVKAVVADRTAAVREMSRLMDAHPGNSEGKRWSRDELYAR